MRDLCDRKKRGWVVEAGAGRGECWGRGKDCESFLLNRILQSVYQIRFCLSPFSPFQLIPPDARVPHSSPPLAVEVSGPNGLERGRF